MTGYREREREGGRGRERERAYDDTNNSLYLQSLSLK